MNILKQKWHVFVEADGSGTIFSGKRCIVFGQLHSDLAQHIVDLHNKSLEEICMLCYHPKSESETCNRSDCENN